MKLIAPYLQQRLDIIKVFGIKKFLLVFIITVLECSIIFLVISALMSAFIEYPVLGAILLSILFILGIGVFCLISRWKKKHDSKEKKELQ